MTKPVYEPKLDLTDWQQTDAKEYEEILSIIAPELHSYVEEHAALGKLMDEVRKGYDEEVYAKALAEIETELNQHFRYEEEFMLPRLARHIRAETAGPIYKLKKEHESIRRNYEEAKALFEQHDPENPSQALVQKVNLLAYLLKKHIEKEDHYLFPLVSAILTAEEKREIAEAIAREYASRGMERA